MESKTSFLKFNLLGTLKLFFFDYFGCFYFPFFREIFIILFWPINFYHLERLYKFNLFFIDFVASYLIGKFLQTFKEIEAMSYYLYFIFLFVLSCFSFDYYFSWSLSSEDICYFLYCTAKYYHFWQFFLHGFFWIIFNLQLMLLLFFTMC